MNSWLSEAPTIRLAFSLGGLAFFWGLAVFRPFRREPKIQSKRRWISNLALTALNGSLMALVVPLSLLSIAGSSFFENWGLVAPNFSSSWLQLIYGVVVLDFFIYWQHRFFHRYDLLWKLHRVHHSDPEFDTTTAGRFHTIEIALSFVVKAIVIVTFGIQPIAVLVFEVLLNFSSLFNHSNFSFPQPIEKILRHLIITPDLHRVHHSVDHDEMNRNFGFSVSFWDQLFRSFRPTSKKDPRTMPIGTDQFRDDKDQGLLQLLIQPFR